VDAKERKYLKSKSLLHLEGYFRRVVAYLSQEKEVLEKRDALRGKKRGELNQWAGENSSIESSNLLLHRGSLIYTGNGDYIPS